MRDWQAALRVWEKREPKAESRQEWWGSAYASSEPNVDDYMRMKALQEQLARAGGECEEARDGAKSGGMVGVGTCVG